MKLIFFFLLTFTSLALAPFSYAQVRNTAEQRVKPGTIYISGYTALFPMAALPNTPLKKQIPSSQ